MILDDLVDDVKDWSKNAQLFVEVTSKLSTVTVHPPALADIFRYCQRTKKSLRQMPPREVLSEIFPLLSAMARHWLEVAIGKSSFINSPVTPAGFTFIFCGVLILCGGHFIYLAHDVIVNFRDDDKQKDPFLRSFIGVADSMQVIP